MRVHFEDGDSVTVVELHPSAVRGITATNTVVKVWQAWLDAIALEFSFLFFFFTTFRIKNKMLA
jgi:hypothetical protein